MGGLILNICGFWVLCVEIHAFVQGTSCTSMVGSHSVYFICVQ